MNENIDLTKILKDCPNGFELYSTLCGTVLFRGIHNRYSIDEYPVKCECDDGQFMCFTKEGCFFDNYNGAECVIFPSKDQRDWSKLTAPWYKKLIEPKFKVGDRVRHKETNRDDVYEISKVYDDSYGIAGFTWMIYMKYQDQYELVPNKFDPKTLKPFDRVLVRDYCNMEWNCDAFSHIKQEGHFLYVCIGSEWKCCIPYNDETKHLVGTTDEAPEYYRYWED